MGPLLISPAQWSEISVDGDGDGRRDPQDIDDAAVGEAVLLCDGRHDLSTRRGLEAAARRLNSTPGFARLVVAAWRRYSDDLRREQQRQATAPELVELAGPATSPPPEVRAPAGPAATAKPPRKPFDGHPAWLDPATGRRVVATRDVLP